MGVFKDLIAIIAMLIVAGILVVCIANDINHGIIYSGLVIISALGGVIITRRAIRK